MKILHINEHYGDVGGAERYLAQICGALAGQGCESIVVASAATTTARKVGPVRVYPLEPSFGLRTTRRAAAPLERLLDSERPDVVHLHNIQYFLGPALLRVIRSHAPVIQTMHDTRVICPRWLSKIIPSATSPCPYPIGSHCFRHGCYPFHQSTANVFTNAQRFFLVGWEMAQTRKLDRIVVHSGYMRDQLLLNGFPADRIATLPLFTSLPHPPPGPGRRKRRIGFAGRIDESKGIRQFLASLAKLPPGDWTAQVAGDGPFLAEAKAIAVREGLRDRVEFLGRLQDRSLTEMLASAYVIVMPSLVPESFGLAGLEALACGTPVVAFDSGGISEWLIDGKTGFVVPWRDVEALAQRLAQLLADEDLAQTLGRQGRQQAARFDIARHMEKLCDIYQEVAAHRCSAVAH
jgi:glycosyltransferase involved in cell wall biosynthesis